MNNKGKGKLNAMDASNGNLAWKLAKLKLSLARIQEQVKKKQGTAISTMKTKNCRLCNNLFLGLESEVPIVSNMPSLCSSVTACKWQKANANMLETTGKC